MELNMPQISIIVPVYNTENYIHRCVDSILAQSFSDFELILIDDGSSDNCPQICDEYAVKDSRIIVLHKKNAGVAAARNSGLDAATGEYITFVDSDDWIESNMYQSMMEKARQYDCDVVMCDCKKEFSGYSELYTHDIRSGYYSYKDLKEEYYPHLLMMENVEYPATISNWLCIFRQRREKMTSSKEEDKNTGNCQPDGSRLRYIEGVRFSEDLLFGAQMMYRAKSFYYMKGQAHYHYCMNPTSATHTFKIDKWNDYLVLFHEAERFFLEEEKQTEFQRQIDLMLLFFIYNAIGDIRNSNLRQREKRNCIKSILAAKESREVFSRLKVVRLPIYWKLKILTVLYKYQIVY